MPEGATRDRYSRVLDLFVRFLLPDDSADIAAPGAPAPLPLSSWLISLWLAGASFKSARLYLDIISGLYQGCAKDGAWPLSKDFARVKAELADLGEDAWKKGIDDEIFSRALSLTKGSSRLEGDMGVAADLVLYSLVNGCMPIMKVAMLTRADVPADDPESRAIALRQLAGTNRKYVFPLGQSVLTRRQVSLRVQQLVTDLFRSRRLPLADNVADVIEGLWAYAALRLNFSPEKVIYHLGRVPRALPVLSLADPSNNSNSSNNSDLSPQRIVDNAENDDNSANGAIAQLFLSNPLGWYVMTMRPGVKFEALDQRVRAESPSLPPITLFYPCEEISRVIKKKVVLRQRPFIPRVVFFQTRSADVARIFSRIGDIAWCYTTSGRPGAPYARIAKAQFERFQAAVASFTPDCEVAESGALPFRENDRVKVVGGLFSGREGEFKAVLQEDDNTVYRIQLIGDNGIDWRVNVDPRLVTSL